MRDIFEKLLGMIIDIENDQIHYFSVEAKKVFPEKSMCQHWKINHKEFSWSVLLNISPPNMQFSSQKIKKFDGKFMWLPSIVTRDQRFWSQKIPL